MKFITLIFIFILFTNNLFAGEKEDKLRGVILERISQFITYKSNKDEFIISVYNNKDMAKTFSKLYKDRKYKNMPIKL